MSTSGRIASYREFWPFYLHQHSKPETRHLHVVGTAGATALLFAAAITFRYDFLIAAFIAGYGPAWLAHFLIEKNQPTTFRYPLWSLAADYHMAGKWLVGQLSGELEKAGVRESPAD